MRNTFMRATHLRASEAPRHKTAFTLVELLVVIAIIGTLVGLLLPAVQAARESARRVMCMSNLRDLGLAVLQYSDIYKILPCGAAGHTEVPRSADYGWAITVLPYIEQQSLYDKLYSDIKTNGTSPGSSIYKETRNTGSIPTLSCPSDPAVAARQREPLRRNQPPLNYSANWGDVQVGVSHPHTTLPSVQMRGPFVNCRCTFQGISYQNPTRPLQITDGLSRTVLLGEVGVVENRTNSKFGLKASVATNGPPSSCLNATAWVQPSNDIASKGWGHGVLWLAAGPTTGFFTILPPNSAPCTHSTDFDTYYVGTISSNHLGGAGVVMCDGRVTFISDTIDCGDSTVTPTGPNNDPTRYTGESMWGVWGALGTISRGENARLTE